MSIEKPHHVAFTFAGQEGRWKSLEVAVRKGEDGPLEPRFETIP